MLPNLAQNDIAPAKVAGAMSNFLLDRYGC